MNYDVFAKEVQEIQTLLLDYGFNKDEIFCIDSFINYYDLRKINKYNFNYAEIIRMSFRYDLNEVMALMESGYNEEEIIKILEKDEKETEDEDFIRVINILNSPK